MTTLCKTGACNIKPMWCTQKEHPLSECTKKPSNFFSASCLSCHPPHLCIPHLVLLFPLVYNEVAAIPLCQFCQTISADLNALFASYAKQAANSKRKSRRSLSLCKRCGLSFLSLVSVFKYTTFKMSHSSDNKNRWWCVVAVLWVQEVMSQPTEATSEDKNLM